MKGGLPEHQLAPWLLAPLGSSHEGAEPYFNSFPEGQEMGACLTSILHSAGTTSEKVLFLDPARDLEF